MTILYDWKKIHTASRGKVRDIVIILNYLTFKTKPRSKSDRLYNFYGRDFSGTSYLLYPDKLLRFKHCYTLTEIAEYMALASYRNYSEYLMSGDSTLKLTHSPVSQQKINTNRLLQISGDKIHFLFEEVMEK